MEDNKIYQKESLWMNVRHLGLILSNLAIFCAIATFVIPLSSILGFFGIAIGFLILFAISAFLTFITLGTIWTTGTIQGMWRWLQKASENQMAFAEFIIKLMPFFAIAGTLLCFASSIILQFIKQDKRKGRIITGYILGALCAILCIICFAGVFNS